MKLPISAVLCALLAAAPAVAHHSFAAFDLKKTVVLDGVLTEVRLTNPHSFFIVEVPAKDGKAPVAWTIEGVSPNQLFAKGLKRSALKAGDHVTLTANPLRSGEIGGSLVSLKLADGTIIEGGPGQ